MEFQQLGALALFAFVATFTPGPNNIMLMTSGANIGLLRTIPHMIGIIIGFAVMLLTVGLGLSQVFNTFPLLHDILKVASLAYLLYLAAMIAVSKPKSATQDYRPMTLLSAAAFQWVNPKAWSMALSAISLFYTNASVSGLLFISVVFAVVTAPSVLIWTLAGTQLQKWLTSPKRTRVFNVTMALMLVGSTIPMI
ncbi:MULTISPECIES: LysE family translocator [Vibrio]|uniref:Putative amino acid transporter n=1 Tax=Vibrio proteolyticus NBRC 13287 TaxID=1219065 RepID=U3BFN7_VIBPR|nr:MULTISPECIES: LysE family translocator [Vibrio]NAX21211.1 LysE family transporter [Vibrio sp. V39_P1S14PM300]GAD68519.1 putative amino acid transporter [Vibrio proteolyticus NBRC 13287]